MLDLHYTTEKFEWRPYLYRWLSPDDEALEAQLIDSREINPIGYRYTGTRRAFR